MHKQITSVHGWSVFTVILNFNFYPLRIFHINILSLASFNRIFGVSNKFLTFTKFVIGETQMHRSKLRLKRLPLKI